MYLFQLSNHILTSAMPDPFHTLVVDPLPETAPTATTRQSPSPSPGWRWWKPATHRLFASASAAAALPDESSILTPALAMARLTLLMSVARPHEPDASSLYCQNCVAAPLPPVPGLLPPPPPAYAVPAVRPPARVATAVSNANVFRLLLV